MKALVLGGGIGGIEAAIACRKQGFEVELVSDREFLFVYPIAIWIPFGTARFQDVAVPLEKLAHRHGFSWTLDRVTGLDHDVGHVTLERAGERQDFDVLVLALGAGKMKHEGLQNTLSICGPPEQALALKERIASLLKRGEGRIAVGFGGNPKDPSAVRGGPAFEFVFNLHHLLTKRRVRNRFTLTFFAPMAEPGARMGPKVMRMLGRMFQRYDISTHYGRKIVGFDADGVQFEEATKIQSDLTMFIPAGDGHPVVKASQLPVNESGFIRINDFLEVDGSSQWYAVGDAAALEGPDWKAKQGHVAEIMARQAAHNAAITHLGRRGTKRGYREHVSILCVMDTGNGAGLVYRDSEKARLWSLPIVGHWLKKGWGPYYRMSKLRYIPRLPGM
jgi:sulfide:quinone oxidoreductase